MSRGLAHRLSHTSTTISVLTLILLFDFDRLPHILTVFPLCLRYASYLLINSLYRSASFEAYSSTPISTCVLSNHGRNSSQMAFRKVYVLGFCRSRNSFEEFGLARSGRYCVKASACAGASISGVIVTAYSFAIVCSSLISCFV